LVKGVMEIVKFLHAVRIFSLLLGDIVYGLRYEPNTD
jgi:hypothetical protein